MKQTCSTTRRRGRLRALVAVAVAGLMLGAAPAANASTAADDQYGAVLGQQAGGPGAAEGAGTLPFTGLDLLLVAGAGTGFAVAGIAARRLAARSRPADPTA
jgi:hypothetical protein